MYILGYRSYMLDVKPIKQSDRRWADELLGNSKTLTIGNSGCAITCLTMLLNYVTGKNFNPSQVNKRMKEVGGFYGALIIWSKINVAFPELKWIYRDYNYSNLKVSSYVYIRRIPGMVEVVPTKNVSSLRHWVLFVGDRKMVDPWDGTIKSTSFYPVSGDSLIQKV